MTVQRIATLSSNFIILEDGPALPAEVIALAVKLESEGFFYHDAEGMFRLLRFDGQTVASLLSDTDRAAIIKWKQHLLALCGYLKQQDDKISKYAPTRNLRAQPKDRCNRSDDPQPKHVND